MAKNGDNGSPDKALGAYVERIESLEAEKKQTAEQINALYSSASAEGLDKDALKQLVKDRKGDMEKTARVRAVVAQYRKKLAGLDGTELGEWAIAFAAAETSARNTRRKLPTVADEGTA